MVFLQKIKDLGILGTGDIVGSALGVIFWFYLASQIEPEQYGQIQWFIGIAGAMSYVALFGSQNTIIVFAAKNLKIQSTLYFISLIASIVLSTIVIVIFPSFYHALQRYPLQPYLMVSSIYSLQQQQYLGCLLISFSFF